MTSLLKEKLDNAVSKINSMMSGECCIQTNMRMLRFRYVERIGMGTFGIVMKIRDSNGDIYALKTVYEDNRHYYREREVLEMVRHDHFVRMYEYACYEESAEGQYVQMVMEYVPYTLRKLITHNKTGMIYGVDKEETVKRLLQQGLRGLAHLHSYNIAHRDIKPSNILIDHDGTLKYCDLGSAKQLDGTGGTTYICSRYYRAPENIMGIKDYTTKIDVWALALSLAEILTRKIIFKGTSNENQLRKILGVLRVSQKDLPPMEMKKKKRESIGIRRYMKKYTSDRKLIDVFEKMIMFSDKKRVSAKEALAMDVFSDIRSKAD